MCFYHSVAINIEIELLEVLDLIKKQLFPEEDASRTFLCYCVKVCIKLINQIVLACEKY